MKLFFRALLVVLFLSQFVYAADDDMVIVDWNQFLGKKLHASLLNRISVEMDQIPFEDAINHISELGALDLNYNRNDIPVEEEVTIHLDDVYAVEALLAILSPKGIVLKLTQEGQMAIVSASGSTGGSTANMTVSGRVIDKETAEPLPGANVLLMGTSFGSATDINGVFDIYNVPAGTYSVKVKYIGYKDQEVDILLRRGEEFFQEFEMEYAAVEGEVVTVTAQAKGQMEAINQQLASRTISSIVASDKIQEVPDANAAESVGRLPGVSIKRSSGEGNEVVIRGLQPKLNLITVNGIRMPSTNENNTAVGLAGVSQYMLDGIEVRKSLTAQDDADVVGGIVDLKLATADEGFHMNAIVDGMYNGLTEELGSYRATLQGSNRFFNNALGVIAQVNMERADRTRERYSANFNRDTRQSVNQGIFLTGGNYQLHEIIRNRFSMNLLLDYRLPKGKIQLNSIYSNFIEDRWERDWSYSVAVGTNTSSKYHTSLEMKNTSLINGLNLETELPWWDMKFDLGASMTQGLRNEPDIDRLRFRYDPQGSAVFDPEFAKNTYEKTGYDAIPAFRDLNDQYIMSSLSRDDVEFEENESTIQTNLTIPVKLSNQFSGFIKFGGKARFKDRNFNYDGDGLGLEGGGADKLRLAILKENPDINWPFTWQNYQSQGQDHLPASPLYDGWTRNVLEDRVLLDGFSSRELVNQILQSMVDVNWTGYSQALVSAGDLQRDYSGDEKLYAGYFMTELNWGSRLSLNAGVRYEHEETRYKGYGVIDIASQDDILDTLDTSTRINYFLLPSANLKWKYLDWADIRLAYSKSLARPDYYGFVPHYYADLRFSLSQTAGNKNLKPSISQNFDLTLSFYNNTVGLFTVGGFYKEIEDYYYVRNFQVIDVAEDNAVHGYKGISVPKGQYVNLWYNSPETAIVKGLEFDWQTSFWYFPKPLNGLILNVNYTLIDTKAHYYNSGIEKIKWGSKPWEFDEVRVDSFETRRMIDQPNNTVNISLGYDYKGFSMRLAYYFQGNTLVGKGQYKEDDTYSQDYERWDFSMNQQLPVEGLSFQLFVNNIMSVPDENYRWIKKFNTFEEYYGRTASVGLKYRF